ncbi:MULTISPECIES: UDP-glucose/GDP-mannose dehydrogenase family protein [unclassified Streptomyces]|uniref:UDP-glucose dehydrogenase family protein n=1 Tax=unclassified Streptomyces TaxID=2593676 RepID=UPI0011644022|nr:MULTISPECIES: UDP-glucose/GDP-mannose dehydrogenase family protein [unclassified Streptomyces]NMI58789.1 UDP-glucose/GDP-mannose dehydrogenase family protein [Streptomyces sp. RLA2-12]QDN58102.1 UDP-glucose/GDP-mannose dehydrogenase family protein [Streptomyces sp. S1D4-20]QDN68197.1 UDP-glucose/GDP-mannose dehydrogenase family protein [Streptomyces sp. S1D4-14]QDO50613.1 UDP-glucose/GDP-mannose dehydrogenase family protein [Streptomyces sp. RLB3-5]QDO60854.1 UDP-glucose/GDP-mannose dehydro
MALKITVIGTGYLGATHAAAMAELGFEVLGLDVVPEKIEMLQRGEVPMYEPGLEELLRKHVAGIEGSTSRLRFTMDWAEVGEFGDVHFVCVNTPQKHGEYACDMSYVDAAFETLAPHLSGPALVVGKSTVPVGSAERLARTLAELSPAGEDAELAWNPEFLREGFAVQDTLHPDRLVVGVRSERAEKILREVYATPVSEGSPFVVTDFPTAELVKTSANSFLATKISFINAMAEVCEAAGGDVALLAEAIGHDERIGKKFLRAGIGFGGGCLPKDIRAFMARAGELGADQALTFLREIDSINMRRRGQMVEMAREALGGGSFLGKRVAVLGATFKPDSDDVRDSPALNVAGQIHLQGGQVTVYDPKGMANAKRLFPTLGYADSAVEAVRGADVVLHLTEWREFRELDPAVLGEAASARLLLDGRNALDPEVWRRAGWTYRAMGRPNA